MQMWRTKVKYFWSKETNRKKHTLQVTRKDERGLITIVNIYAPTSELATKNPREAEEVYAEISKLLYEYKNKSLLFLICGDFNSRIGKEKEECTGRYGSGKRNNSGQQLIDYCNINNLFIANTAFEHPTSQNNLGKSPSKSRQK